MVLGIAAPSEAFNTRFLRYSAISRFNKKDMTLLKETAKKALDEAPDNTVLDWNNAESGNSGSAQPLRTYQKGSSTCRLVKFTNQHKDIKGVTKHTLCKQTSGEWKFLK
jgi:surface antigen